MAVEPLTVSLFQRRLLNPIFAFAREMVNNRVAGFENYQVQRPINFHHELTPADFPITDAVFKAFKDFAMSQDGLNVSAAQLDHNRAFIARQLRFNLVSAAYGRVTADRVLITTDDPQVAKAVESVPRARDLAQTAMHSRGQ